MLIWLSLFCALGFYWSKLFGEGTPNPFILTADGTAILISVTMLAVGSLLPRDEVLGVVKTWPKTLGGTCIQYLSMPTLAYCVAKFLQLDEPYFIGIMTAGCVPGAMASNVLTMTARGNVSYSVGLTTSATLLSPLIVPATLWFFFRDHKIAMDFGDVMLNLLMTVVAPTCIGFAASQRWKWWNEGAKKFAEIIANIAIIWIIAGVTSKNADALSKMSPILILSIILLNFGGCLAGWLGGYALRLTPGMRRALTLEVGMQNAGLGAALAMRYFGDIPEASVYCAAYAFECMTTGVILAQIFRFCARNEKASTEN